MKNFGRTTVSEFLGDFVVYRNLAPADPRLKGLDAIRDVVGIPAERVPRKSEPDYARVIVHILHQARALDSTGAAIERLVYVGDTRLNDSTAFANICQAGRWPGLAFIASETDEPARTETVGVASLSIPIAIETDDQPTLFLANRWGALAEFERYCAASGFPIDANTAVIVDLDKTALGARGRNAHVIDQARVSAVRLTVADLLGDAFDQTAFQRAYDHLNQQEFHPFTADNQDYLAYICLILGSGLYDLDSVVADVQDGRLNSFNQFISNVNERADAIPADLRSIHSEIYANVCAGDPTPFKAFRYNEYQTTIARMGHMDDDTLVEELLAEEIVITQELRSQALEWQAQGALLFGLSDKPDEASIPSQELVNRGYRSIHKKETHAVGG
jgi:hypothetical protein